MEKTKRWVLVAGWMGLIFYLSSISNFKVPDKWISSISSNIAHFIEFFILCMLLFRAIKKSTRWGIKKIIVASCVFSVIYAFLDEFHQSFVPERFPSFMDILVDTLGILSFGGIVWKENRKKSILFCLINR